MAGSNSGDVTGGMIFDFVVLVFKAFLVAGNFVVAVVVVCVGFIVVDVRITVVVVVLILGGGVVGQTDGDSVLL